MKKGWVDMKQKVASSVAPSEHEREKAHENARPKIVHETETVQREKTEDKI